MAIDIFTRNEDGTLPLREAIGQALGAASMCWEPKPEGVFDSEEAGRVLHALWQFILNEGNTNQRYIWIVKSSIDPNDLNSRKKVLSLHASEDKAFRANRDVYGPCGHPRTHGGEIWKVALGERYEEHMIFGPREDWNGNMTHGWTDLRDRPDDEDPEWIEFKRLQDIFDPRKAGR